MVGKDSKEEASKDILILKGNKVLKKLIAKNAKRASDGVRQWMSTADGAALEDGMYKVKARTEDGATIAVILKENGAGRVILMPGIKNWEEL